MVIQYNLLEGEEEIVNTLSKAAFIELIAKKNGITKAEATRVINYFTAGIEKVVSAGNKLSLKGFGSFYIASNKARQGRNPRTGEAIKISAYKTPKFKAGAALKKACN